MSEDGYWVNGRYYDSLSASVNQSGRKLTLRFKQETYEYIGEPSYIKFWTKNGKIGFRPYNVPPGEPYNRIYDNNDTSVSWFIGTVGETIESGLYDLERNEDIGLWVFEPRTESVPVGKTHNRFSEEIIADI